MMNATAVAAPSGPKIIPLHFWACFFLDSEDGNYPSTIPNLVYNCRIQGQYVAGPEVGRILCVMILVMIYIVGLFGFVSNVLNVLVLRRSLKGASLSMKRLLIMMAAFELFACMFSIVYSTVILTIKENLDRSEGIWQTLKVFSILFAFGRTGSIYITILVTIERYLVVAYPVQSKAWLTPLKSKIYLVSVIIFSAILDFPWIFNSTVVANPYAQHSPMTTLKDFPYLMKMTEFGIWVYPKVRGVLLGLNFVAPFPLLLIFNILLYRSLYGYAAQIYNWNKSRQSLSRKQKKEISAAKMFSVVVMILLSCHTVTCVMYFSTQYFQTIHRELLLLQNFSTTLAASMNFLVYFGFGKAFRQEFRRLMNSNWARVTGKSYVETSGTGPTSSSKDDGEHTSEIQLPETGVGARGSSGLSCCTTATTTA